MNKNEEQLNIDRGEREAFVLLRSKILSVEEKDMMWRSLQISIRQLHSKSISQKGFQIADILSLFMRRSFVLSVFLIVIIIGGGFGVARAAESSLPGQALYPVKINVNEPIIGSFKLSDSAKIVWEQKRVERRIAEAEVLAEGGKLGVTEKDEIEQQLSQNRKTIERIKGRIVTDDEFFPEQISGETQKINVNVDHSQNETLVRIEERTKNSDNGLNKKSSDIVSQEKGDTSFGGYTKNGTKIKKEKKIENKSKSEVQTEK